jgi:competence protein ComFC
MKFTGNKIKNFLTPFIDFVFPKICIVSEKRIPEKNSNKYIHDDILASLERISNDELIEFKVKVKSDQHFSHFSFSKDDDFARIVYHFKYHKMKKLGIFLGSVIGYELSLFMEDNSIKDFDYLIPVPLHKTKERERGYNQSEYICMGISERIKIEIIPDLVIRTRNTKTQTRLDLKERESNVKDAFAVNEKFTNGFIKNKKIILVDDIVTTGSTLNEIIKVLREKECGEIMCCTLAMAKN